jgi:hypothetical protein
VVLGAGEEQISLLVELDLGQRSFVAWNSQMGAGCAGWIGKNKNLVARSAAADGTVNRCRRDRGLPTDHVLLECLSTGIRTKKDDGDHVGGLDREQSTLFGTSRRRNSGRGSRRFGRVRSWWRCALQGAADCDRRCWSDGGYAGRRSPHVMVPTSEWSWAPMIGLGLTPSIRS